MVRPTVRPRSVLRLLLGLPIVGAATACGNGSDTPAGGAHPVAIHLATVPVCRIDGRLARPPARSMPADAAVPGDAREVIVVPHGGVVDFHQRLPADSYLTFRPVPATAALRVSATSDDASAVIEPEADAARGVGFPLQRFDGAVVRLRIENVGEGPALLERPVLHGTGTMVAPELPAAPGPVSPPRNVLVYVVDALRVDRLSAYGYARPTSPRLETFAESGTRFTNAYSAGPHTGTSIPSLFTSVAPSEVSDRLRPSPAAIPHTLAERFRDGGYDTAAFTANFLLVRSQGYARGFETYVVLADSAGGLPVRVPASELHRRALEWLRRPRDRPFFLYIQSLDVHDPYAPPPPFRGRFGGSDDAPPPELGYTPPDWGPQVSEFFRKSVRALEPQYYDDAVAYADHEIGGLLDSLDALGLREHTVIVVTADHGESLGDGGRYLHGLSVTEELVNVPLLVSIPGVPGAREVEAVVSLMDLAPTLSALAGLSIPEQFRGRDLLRPSWRHSPPVAVGERTGPQGFQEWFVRQERWKVIATRSGARLFDIREDPGESTDRSAERPVLTEYLTSVLWGLAPGFRDGKQAGRRADGADLEGLDDAERREVEDALRALGYVE
jgi:arylsulfatase A-like enzyme